MYTLKSFMAFTKARTCFSMILYFSVASLKILLKKAMGCSRPSSFFCNKTAAMVYSEANEKIMKSLLKLGIMRTYVLVSASLTA